VFLPERKELHWLDHKWDRPLRDWASHFAPGRGRVRGEITPAYGLLPAERIRFLRRILPELRLVLLLRHPADRAWSQVAMELERAGRRPDTVPEAELLAALEADAVRSRSAYGEILGRWLAVFPAESLLVGFHEEIAEKPRELLVRVFRHIGVSDAVDWSRFPLGDVIVQRPRGAPEVRGAVEGAACPEPVRRELERRYKSEVEALAARFEPARRWLAR
jgi:hypothetical protein